MNASGFRRASSKLASSATLAAFLLLTMAAMVFGEANYVYHERTGNDVTGGASSTCGGAQAYVPILTPSSAQSHTLRYKVEYQFFTDTLRVYYTTDGSTPSGAFGVPSGSTLVATGSYQCNFTFSGNVIDVATATIPAQPAGTVVKYIVSAWHSGGGLEIFGNGPGTPCGGCGTPTSTAAQATVFQYTVSTTPTPVVLVEARTSSGGKTADPPYTETIGTWADSGSRSGVAGLTAGVTGSRFASAAGAAFRVTPTLVPGVTYTVQATFQSASASSDLTVSVAATGTSASTLPATTTVFRSANGHTWQTIGTITPSSTTPTVTFTQSGGTISSTARFYADAVRFVPVNAAGTKTWNGGGTDNLWTSGANWGGTAPNLSGDALVFAGPTRLTPAVDGNFTPTSITFANNAGTFAFSGSALATAAITNNSANPQVITNLIVQGSTPLAVNANSGNVALGGVITGTGGYSKSGAATLTLSNSGNTITGPVTVSGGTLEIVTSGRIGGTAAGAGDITLSGGALRNLDSVNGNSFLTANRNIILGANGGTVDVPAASTIALLYSGIISGTGNTLFKAGTGEFRAGGANSFGKLVITQGLYRILNTGTEASLGASPANFLADAITISNAANVGTSITYPGNTNRGIFLGPGGGGINTSAGNWTNLATISGPGPLLKPTSGTLVIASSNSFSGGLQFNGGTISFNNDFAAGTGAISITPSSAVTFRNTILLTTLTNDIVINSGSSTADFFATTGNTLALNGVISGAGNWSRGSGGGAGAVLLGGGQSNTFSGALNVLAGTLTIAKNGALGATNGATTVASGSTLGVQGGINYTIPELISLAGGGVSASGALNNISGNNVLGVLITLTNDSVFNVTSGSLELNGSVGGLFAVTKTGPGKLVLSSANSFGNLSVLNGALVVASSVPGNVLVSTGAVLNGPGTVLGSVTVNGAISPGASPGTLSTGPQIWNGGGIYTWEINDAAGTQGGNPGFDLLNITGSLAINASPANKFIIDISSLGAPAANFANTTPQGWTILKTTAGITGFDPAAFDVRASNFVNTLAPGNLFRITTNATGTDLVLQFVPNRAPVASNLTAATVANQSVAIPAAKLLNRAGDADGDPLVLSVSATSTNGGTVSLASGVVTYTPAPNFTGTDAFTYTVTDPFGFQASALVVVTVGSSNSISLNVVGGPTLNNGVFSVQFAGVPGYTYSVQWAPAVTGPWTTFTNVTAGANGLFQVTEDVGSPGPTERYYRTTYP